MGIHERIVEAARFGLFIGSLEQRQFVGNEKLAKRIPGVAPPRVFAPSRQGPVFVRLERATVFPSAANAEHRPHQRGRLARPAFEEQQVTISSENPRR